LAKAADTLFEVSGYEIKQSATGEQTTENFNYLAKNVVLAIGTVIPNVPVLMEIGIPLPPPPEKNSYTILWQNPVVV
jgi:hypothetical protein